MNLVRIAMKALILKARAFERAAEDPMKVQEKVLLEYLARNKDTEYGRDHRFSGVASIRDFQSRVPMSDCEGLRPPSSG